MQSDENITSTDIDNTNTDADHTNTDADMVTEIDTTLESIGVDTLVDSRGQVHF